MLLHDSRRDARVDADGELVLLDDQDRARWDRAEIAEGLALVERALALGGRGPYALQAAIAAEHARAPRRRHRLGRIAGALRRSCERVDPTPVVALNRAVAVAMAHGPAGRAGAGRRARRAARRLPPAATPRAPTCCAGSDRRDEAADGLPRARSRCAGNPVERAFLERRLAELQRVTAAQLRARRWAAAVARPRRRALGPPTSRGAVLAIQAQDASAARRAVRARAAGLDAARASTPRSPTDRSSSAG